MELKDFTSIDELDDEDLVSFIHFAMLQLDSDFLPQRDAQAILFTSLVTGHNVDYIMRAMKPEAVNHVDSLRKELEVFLNDSKKVWEPLITRVVRKIYKAKAT